MSLSKVEITFDAFLLVLSLCSSPGEVVMWSYTLHRLFEKTKSLITIAVLANEWAYGFPTQETMKKFWDSQKCPGKRPDNLLDYASTWE